LDHIPDLFIKLQVNHLLLQDILIVEVKLSHVGINVLVNFLALEHHENLSLASHFIQYVVDDVSAKNHFTSISESKIYQNLLELVELVKLVLRK
jgi:hypothetical protein